MESCARLDAYTRGHVRRRGYPRRLLTVAMIERTAERIAHEADLLTADRLCGDLSRKPAVPLRPPIAIDGPCPCLECRDDRDLSINERWEQLYARPAS